MTKRKVKKIVSGLLSAITIMTSVVQPITAYAAEVPSYEEKYPALEAVRDVLDEDEIVIANDYEVEVGSNYEVKVDFSGLEINTEKVNVAFQEAKGSVGQDFDINHKDSYKAVYLVEPISGNPSYHVSRNITVKEAVVEVKSEKNTIASREAAQMEKEESEDEESELTVDEVIVQAEEQGINLMVMEEGESVTFYAAASARAVEQVTVTRGECYYYSTYGYGTYLTYKYTVQYDDVSATAYCIQLSVTSPGSGSYSISKLGDSKALSKVCYYGTKASGDEGFFEEKYPSFSAGQRFILVHITASYANGSSDAFSGASNGTVQLLYGTARDSRCCNVIFR